jgi:hypothetical protein
MAAALKRIREKKTIYLSWAAGDAEVAPWVEKLWGKLWVQKPPQPPALKRADKLVGPGQKIPPVDEILADVTDMVAVVNVNYMMAVPSDPCETNHEFVRFLRLMKPEDAGSRRPWIALVENLEFEWLLFAGQKLSRECLLKDPKFALPPNDDELQHAVIRLVLGKDQDE